MEVVYLLKWEDCSGFCIENNKKESVAFLNTNDWKWSNGTGGTFLSKEEAIIWANNNNYQLIDKTV